MARQRKEDGKEVPIASPSPSKISTEKRKLGKSKEPTEAAKKAAKNDLIYTDPNERPKKRQKLSTEDPPILPVPIKTRQTKINSKYWKDGNQLLDIKFQLNQFYLIKPPPRHVSKEDKDTYFLVKVVGVPKDKRSLRSKRSALNNLPPMLQYYRSWDKIEEKSLQYREFLPVWIDSRGTETWDDKIDPKKKKSDKGHDPWVCTTWPRGVLDIPFSLHEKHIPKKIWDLLKSSDVDLTLIGAQSANKTVRGKKH